MDKISFLVISESSGEEYQVVATHSDNGLTFSCSCAAGVKGQLCKHRLSILDGTSKSLASMDPSKISQFKDWVSSSTLPVRMKLLEDAEAEVVRAKKSISSIKGEMGRRLDIGI
jgi:hypothetical protein